MDISENAQAEQLKKQARAQLEEIALAEARNLQRIQALKNELIENIQRESEAELAAARTAAPTPKPNAALLQELREAAAAMDTERVQMLQQKLFHK